MKSHSVVVLTVAFMLFLMWIPVSLSCNKALCASDVSKCLIQVGLRVLFITIQMYHTADIEHMCTDIQGPTEVMPA